MEDILELGPESLSEGDELRAWRCCEGARPVWLVEMPIRRRKNKFFTEYMDHEGRVVSLYHDSHADVEAYLRGLIGIDRLIIHKAKKK